MSKALIKTAARALSIVMLFSVMMLTFSPGALPGQLSGARGGKIIAVPRSIRTEIDFDASHSVGLFVGIRHFEDRDFAEVPYAVDDAVDLAYLFAFDLRLIAPKKVFLSLEGEPQKSDSQERLRKLLKAGAKRRPAKSYEILDLVEDLASKKSRSSGLFVVTLATHGFSNEGRDFLLASDSLRHSTSELRLTLVEVELTRSYAQIRTEDGDPATLVRPGDLFELEHWAVLEEASLQVRIPTIEATADGLLAFVRRLADVADGNRVRWVHDPVVEKPTHVLDWRVGSWRLWAQRGGEQSLGARPGAAELRRALPEEGKVRLFVHLPLTQDLRRRIRLGEGTVHDMVEKVPDDAEAIYVLTGRRRQGRLEYAWIRPGVTAGDEATSSLPLRTRWVSFDAKTGATTAARKLEDLALRLGRIRAWLTLEPPTTDLYPYRLALRKSETQELKLGDTAPRRRLADGERYGLVLHAGPEELEKPFEPLYVYAFFIDSTGKSTLVFPRGQQGSVENRLPDMSGPPPSEMPIGRQPILEMSEPHGIDTYFLLVTSEPLPDPFVLAAEAVRGRDPCVAHPLGSLLRNRGAITRGDSVALTPTTWSIDRVSFQVNPGATDL